MASSSHPRPRVSRDAADPFIGPAESSRISFQGNDDTRKKPSCRSFNSPHMNPPPAGEGGHRGSSLISSPSSDFCSTARLSHIPPRQTPPGNAESKYVPPLISQRALLISNLPRLDVRKQSARVRQEHPQNSAAAPETSLPSPNTIKERPPISESINPRRNLKQGPARQ